ncbi:lytic transglycosylase domain-containing protein [Pseudomonas sp. C9-3]|uniref:lytic transglycosylase domain-containing protein n=1 Tax=Pseudomonas sp. C9-3 TaxID=3078264 RepID=UPI0028E9FA6A|nr:lytic transglycosylase domain-containing protein [Pseudomonas sp. C9-3]
MNYDDLLEEAGRTHNVDPSLLRLVMTQESAGNVGAVSQKGARGLMQLMPATAREMGVTDINDPRQNIFGGARYLAQQLDKYNDVGLALAAYNAGPGAVDRAGGVPNYPETKNYVSKIMGRYQNAAPAAPAAEKPAGDSAFRNRFGAVIGDDGNPQSASAASAFQQRFGSMLAEQPTPTAAPEAAPTAPALTPETPGLASQIGGAGLRVANALGRGISDVLDAPSEWLAGGAEKVGLTGALNKLGVPMPTYEQQVELNRQSREDYAQRAGDSGALKVARLVGNIGGVMIPIAGAEAGLASGGNALVNALRGGGAQLLANAAQGAGRFLTGQGGMLSRAAYGAEQGAAGGALLSGGGGDAKADATLGALLGAPLGAVAPPLINAGTRAFNSLRGLITPASSVRPAADQILTRAASQIEEGGAGAVPSSVLSTVRGEVEQALRAGQRVDPAAVARRLDFETVGVQPTLGQITRDPTQYTRERNLRGVESAGETLAQRFSQQNNQLMRVLGDLRGGEAAEADVAGNTLMARLRLLDTPDRQAVDRAYQAARGTDGRPVGLDRPHFSQAANNALDEGMLGRWLPAQVRHQLNDVSEGIIPLNVNNAVQLDSVWSEAQRNLANAGKSAEARAVGVVRDALNRTPIATEAGAESKAAFDQARGLARQRFQQIEDVPALGAALNEASPDRFVQKFLIQSDTPDAQALAQYLARDPQAMHTARGQIVAYLQNKGLGTNSAGDSMFRPEAFNKALRGLGTNKLSAFFNPEEVAQLNALGRVAANIGTQPAGSAVNNSNTAAAAANLLRHIGGGAMRLPVLDSLRHAASGILEQSAARNALSPMLGQAAEQQPANQLIRLLAPTAESAKPDSKRRSTAKAR